jgi:hypothetical protein
MSCRARPLPDESRQALCAAPARNETKRNFRLAELRGLHRDPHRASHRGLAAATQRKAIHGGDDRLAQVLDQVEDLLPEPARLFRFDRADMCELVNVGARDERFVAGARQDDAAYPRVVAGALERPSQIDPGRGIQSVQHLGPIDCHIGDRALGLVKHVCEVQRRHRRLWRRRNRIRFGSHVGFSCLKLRASEPASAPARELRHTKAPMPVIALPTIRFCI